MINPAEHDHSHVKVGNIIEIMHDNYRGLLFKVLSKSETHIRTQSLDSREFLTNWEYNTSYKVVAIGNITEDQLKALIHLHESSKIK